MTAMLCLAPLQSKLSREGSRPFVKMVLLISAVWRFAEKDPNCTSGKRSSHAVVDQLQGPESELFVYLAILNRFRPIVFQPFIIVGFNLSRLACHFSFSIPEFNATIASRFDSLPRRSWIVRRRSDWVFSYQKLMLSSVYASPQRRSKFCDLSLSVRRSFLFPLSLNKLLNHWFLLAATVSSLDCSVLLISSPPLPLLWHFFVFFRSRPPLPILDVHSKPSALTSSFFFSFFHSLTPI